jgi:hypothetical protein
MRGAGGSQGGIGEFLLGFVMMCGGFYMLLQSIVISSRFSLGTGLFRFGAFGGTMNITGGMILIPLLIGIFFIFYNSKSIVGWGLTIGSMTALLFGVISSLSISMRSMTAFEMITILVLAFGGLGLFLKSLREGG